MPFRKYLGVELWSPDGRPDTTLVGGKPKGNVHIRKDEYEPNGAIAIAVDNGKNGTPQYEVNTLVLTKMEALALSHELRKLAIGV